MDWGDGNYEVMAPTLFPASLAALDALGELEGKTLIDVGCGTGNAAIEAARRGAAVTAIDPAVRLLEVTAKRATDEGLSIVTAPGDGAAIGSGDASFECAVSVFAVIFAPDAQAVAKELRRVIKSGGRLAIVAWLPEGAVFTGGAALRREMLSRFPPPPNAPPPAAWHDTAFIEALFGAPVTTTTHTLRFTAGSAAEWFAQQESEHPIWRGAKPLLEADGTWERLRAFSIAALEEGNVATGRFETPARYVVHCVQL